MPRTDGLFITKLDALNEASLTLRNADPEAILAWAVEQFPDGKLAMATAFGAEGCALIAMLADIGVADRLRVFNLETGYQFQETLDLRDRLAERYGVVVELIKPVETVIEMETRFGGPIYRTNPDECCRIRKIEPLKRALVGHDAWLTAIRRDQTPDRAIADVVEWDHRFNLVKVNPLAHWTRADVWAYIKINEVPYNPLHDQGFPSIGCRPCTRAVHVGDGERSGRWSSFAKLECGLHTRGTAIPLPQGEVRACPDR